MEMGLVMIGDLMSCWSHLLSGVMQQMNLLAKGMDGNSAELRQFCFARDCIEAPVLP